MNTRIRTTATCFALLLLNMNTLGITKRAHPACPTSLSVTESGFAQDGQRVFLDSLLVKRGASPGKSQALFYNCANECLYFYSEGFGEEGYYTYNTATRDIYKLPFELQALEYFFITPDGKSLYIQPFTRFNETFHLDARTFAVRNMTRGWPTIQNALLETETVYFSGDNRRIYLYGRKGDGSAPYAVFVISSENDSVLRTIDVDDFRAPESFNIVLEDVHDDLLLLNEIFRGPDGAPSHCTMKVVGMDTDSVVAAVELDYVCLAKFILGSEAIVTRKVRYENGRRAKGEVEVFETSSGRRVKTIQADENASVSIEGTRIVVHSQGSKQVHDMKGGTE